MRQADRSSKRRVRSLRGALAAIVGAAFMAIAPAAQAGTGLVVPQSPAPVTPHATPAPTSAPAPRAAPTPTPTLPPAPTSSEAPTPTERYGSGSDSGYPFPEGLPDYADPGCDLSCAQEWYAYYFGKAQDELMEGIDPDSPRYRIYIERAEEAGAMIEAQGGDPEAFTGNGDDFADGAGASGPGEMASPSPPARSANPTPAPADLGSLVPDAVSEASPLINSDGSRVVVEQGIYEIDIGWIGDLWNAFSNLFSPETNYGTLCPKTETPDGKVSLCPN